MAGDDTTNTMTPLKPVTPIAQYQCPKLKTTNYTVWAIQIKVILEAHDLWEAIEPKENTQVDDKKDKATTAFLYQALTEDVILQVAGCKTAKELWESLKKRHVGEEKVQQARLQSLMIGFQTLLLIKVERSKNRLYSITLQIEAPICLLANVDNQAWLWHARLGHLNFDDINKMTRKGLVEGIPRINHAGQICDACLLGKHSRTPFPNQAKFRSKNPLDLVYGDLCGPISPATHSRKKFIFLLVDECTRFMWAYFLTLKDQAFNTFKEFRQQIEMEMRIKLRMLRTDRGGEFTSNEFTKYCKENGIAR
ncbi:zinc finger, CCHC-type containing protein [Tanacetum coccineum]